jgi:hypothetical protein
LWDERNRAPTLSEISPEAGPICHRNNLGVALEERLRQASDGQSALKRVSKNQFDKIAGAKLTPKAKPTLTNR